MACQQHAKDYSVIYRQTKKEKGDPEAHVVRAEEQRHGTRWEMILMPFGFAKGSREDK